MELMTKQSAALLTLIVLLLCGCQSSTSHLGKPIRTIENPVDLQKYQDITDSYVREMELWRTDPKTVVQIEIYKLEGKNAVMLDRNVIKQKSNHYQEQVTTRKYIYMFYLDLPEHIARPWWVSKIEVYNLPSQRPEDNPALQGPSPVMRDPSSLKRLENPHEDPAPPDLLP
jgi:hypothetical protein